MKNSTVYSTNDLMKLFEIGRNTLRLYEEMGLLTNLKRTQAGYRQYTQQHLEELKFIIDAKNVGFSLKEIKNLLNIVRSEKKVTCGTVSSELSEKISEIDKQILLMISKKSFLNDFLKTCGSKSENTTCDVTKAGFNKTACC